MNILVINGPNLNLLGKREPKIYGYETLEELMMWLENSTKSSSHKFKFYQTNHEGEIIDIFLLLFCFHHFIIFFLLLKERPTTISLGRSMVIL